jgi:hypothetical protein
MVVTDLQTSAAGKRRIQPDIASKARHAAASCAQAYIVNGREHEELLVEVFSNEGMGTTLVGLNADSQPLVGLTSWVMLKERE